MYFLKNEKRLIYKVSVSTLVMTLKDISILWDINLFLEKCDWVTVEAAHPFYFLAYFVPSRYEQAFFYMNTIFLWCY